MVLLNDDERDGAPSHGQWFRARHVHQSHCTPGWEGRCIICGADVMVEGDQ